jgi:phosphoribosylglycinamide formyltransferase-1
MNKNIVILISGGGSNMAAIVQTAQRDNWQAKYGARVAAVLSNKADARGLVFAREQGIATQVLDHKAYASREAFDAALMAAIDAHQPALVVLAGFMRILSPAFVDAFEGRMVNIHPSLLPRHRGLHTHRRVLEAGEREHGASVHFVTRELDGGPVVLQARVPVRDDDDEASLAARVLEQEHRIYPAAIGWFAAGRLRYRDGAAWLDGRRLDHPVVIEAADEIAA